MVDTVNTKEQGLVTGSYFFLGAWFLSAIVIGEYVRCATKDSDPQIKSANRKMAWGLTLMSAIMMWAFWACVYMH